MKKPVVIFIVLLFAFHFELRAQTNSNENNPWSIGVGAYVGESFRKITINDFSAINSDIAADRELHEDFITGFTGQLNVQYNFTPSLGLESGLQYAVRGYKGVYENLVFGDIIDPRLGFTGAGGAGITKVDFLYRYHFLSLPVRARLNVGKNKVRWTSGLGFSFDYLNSYRVTTMKEKIDGTIDSDTQKYSSGDVKMLSFNGSVLISTGVQYQLTAYDHPRIELYYRSALSPTADVPISDRLWDIGLCFSYVRSF